MSIRKYLRKGAAGLLAAVLLCAAGGCQNGGNANQLDPKNPVPIEIWHYYNGPQKIAFDELVSEFNETVGLERGVAVEAFSKGNVTELIESVMNAANKKVGAGEVPDIFAAYADTAYQVDKLDLVAELDSYLTQEELDAFIPGYIEEGRFSADQKLKIFPTAKSTELFMLNKTDWEPFAQATGAKLEDLATVEGVTRTAQAYYEWTDSLTDAPEDGRAFFGRDALANYFIIGSKQLGVELFSVKDGKVTIQADGEVFRRLWDNYYVPYVNGYFTSKGKFRSDDMKTGLLQALVCSTSGAAYFPDTVTLSDTESYPIESITLEPPVFEGGERVAVQQGAGMVVTKSDSKTEYACTVFLKWFTEAERNVSFAADSGYMPVLREANDVGLLDRYMEGREPGMVTNNLKQALPVAFDMTKSFSFYTNKAFQGGTEARAVVENSMQTRAAADREAVLAQIAQGTSRADAVAGFDTDANFEDWFQSFQQELAACTAGD